MWDMLDLCLMVIFDMGDFLKDWICLFYGKW